MRAYTPLVHSTRRLAGTFVLLTIVLQTACAARDNGITRPGGTGNVPAVLVGTWGQAAASGSQYCDPNGGGCTSAYGGSESYTLAAGGTFVYSQLLEANLYGCTIKTYLYATGALTVNGSRLTLTPTSARNQVKRTCGRSTDEQLTLDPSSYNWRVDGAGGGTAKLYLTSSIGEENGPYTPR